MPQGTLFTALLRKLVQVHLLQHFMVFRPFEIKLQIRSYFSLCQIAYSLVFVFTVTNQSLGEDSVGGH